MDRVILTGGTGFIGSWLTEELLNRGMNLTLIVRNKDKILPEFRSSIKIVERDSYDIPMSVFEDEKYSLFYHLAWGGVQSEEKNNIELQLRNIKDSIEAIQLAKRLNCQKFIASGTVAEYVFSRDILDVNVKQTPNDMYGAAKVSSHYFLDVLARRLKQPFIWAVLPSTFGERRKDNNIITYTIRSLLKGEKPSYGNLEQMWDFLYVSEVVRALYLIGVKGVVGKTYGIGSGVYKPLKDYIVKIRDIINPSLELGINEYLNYSQQTLSSCVNIFDIIKDTGFVPQVDFETGIRRTIDYYRKEQELMMTSNGCIK